MNKKCLICGKENKSKRKDICIDCFKYPIENEKYKTKIGLLSKDDFFEILIKEKDLNKISEKLGRGKSSIRNAINYFNLPSSFDFYKRYEEIKELEQKEKNGTWKEIYEFPDYLICKETGEIHRKTITINVKHKNKKCKCHKQIIYLKKVIPGITKNGEGYFSMKLNKRDENGNIILRKSCFLHKVLMETFCPVKNMKKLEVNHIDHNKLNNSLDNLEWCTHKENMKKMVNFYTKYPNKKPQKNLQFKEKTNCKLCGKEIIKNENEICSTCLSKQKKNEEKQFMFLPNKNKMTKKEVFNFLIEHKKIKCLEEFFDNKVTGNSTKKKIKKIGLPNKNSFYAIFDGTFEDFNNQFENDFYEFLNKNEKCQKCGKKINKEKTKNSVYCRECSGGVNKKIFKDFILNKSNKKITKEMIIQQKTSVQKLSNNDILKNICDYFDLSKSSLIAWNKINDNILFE